MDQRHTYIENLQKTFSEYLKNKKLRNTAERDAIFSMVCNTKEPFTLELIWLKLESDNFHVSRASVYNTIELLLNSKIVVRHQFTSSIVQYELKCLAENHNHVICTLCGTVRKVKDEKLSSYFSDYKIPKFTSEYYTLYIYGICSKCKYRIMREEIKKNKSKHNNIKDEKS